MPRVSKIKWRDKDVKELQRLVKNFNAKLSRVQRKKPGDVEFLPEKLTVKGVQAEVTTRAEFKRRISSFKRFAERGAEQVVTAPAGFKVTKFAVKEAKENTRILNIIKAKKRKKLGLTPEKGVESQIENLALKPRKFELGKSREAFEKMEETLKRQLSVAEDEKALQRYKDNYLKGIAELGGRESEILERIKALDNKTLFDLTVDNPKLTIDFHYDDEFSEDTRADEILAEWEFVLS